MIPPGATLRDALQVVSALVRDRYERLNAPATHRPNGKHRRILLNTQAVADAIQAATRRELRKAEIDSAVGVEFRAITEDQATRCAPAESGPRKRKCWVVNNGYYIEVKSLSRTPTGWDVVAQYQFTSEGPTPDESEIQMYEILHSFERRNGEWVETRQEIIAQS